jgi:anti-sigma factor RsiW
MNMRSETHLSDQLLQEYALGLLAREERRQVAQHTAVCPHCQQALARETAVSTLVQHTLVHAGRPTAAQLERMMPPITRPSQLSQFMAWLYGPLRQPVALAGLLLILLFSSLSLHQSTVSPVWASPSPTYVVVTATATGEPTATQTAQLSGTAVPIAYQEQIQPIIRATPEAHSRWQVTSSE